MRNLINPIKGKKIRSGFLLILLSFLNIFSSPQFKEQELRAMFLEAALRFITWPPKDSIFATKTVFTIGTYEGDKMQPYLVNIFKNKAIYNKTIKFVNLTDSLIDCDLLLLPQNHEKKVPLLIRSLRGKNCLTVTDNPDLLNQGVLMCIAVENQKVKLYFSEEILENSKLKISHHLLKKSKIIQTKREKHE